MPKSRRVCHCELPKGHEAISCLQRGDCSPALVTAELALRLLKGASILAAGPQRLALGPQRLVSQTKFFLISPKRLAVGSQRLALEPERLVSQTKFFLISPKRLTVGSQRLASDESRVSFQYFGAGPPLALGHPPHPSALLRTGGEQNIPHMYQAKRNFRPLRSKPVCTHSGRLRTDRRLWRRAGVADPFRAKKLGRGVLGLIHVGAAEGQPWLDTYGPPSNSPRTQGESKTSPPLRLRGGLRGGWPLAVPNFVKRYPERLQIRNPRTHGRNQLCIL